MMRTHFIRSMVFAIHVLISLNVKAQEFPVAVGSDTTFSGGAVYGGLNGIVAVQGDNTSQYTINAQLVGAGGTLIGSRISLGAFGMTPGAIPIFDGTNYFLIWREFDGNLKGQFVNTSGDLVGNSISIAANASIQRPGSCSIAIVDTTFLVAFTKTDDYLYGQFVGKSGSLIGGQIQISSNHAREVSLAYDNTNILVTWVEIIPDTDKDIYGQFVSKTGSLVGTNFLIDGGPNYSDNPTSLAFDGTRYFLVFHDQPPLQSKWFMMGRFISTSGEIEETITICDTSLSPLFPSVAFDNENYLVTWTQLTDMSLRGRFYNKSGTPIDTPFVIMYPSGNKIPLGGVGFGGGLYLVVATKVDSNFSNGDVYARFISPLSTGVTTEIDLMPENNTLLQNYPNPFNPTTNISFRLSSRSFVSLNIFDVLGREVATLVNEEMPAGSYTKQWNAAILSSGVYFYRLQARQTSGGQAGLFTQTKKLLVVR
jgi:hypothetical protein